MPDLLEKTGNLDYTKSGPRVGEIIRVAND
jgi:hypothetical protein